jgi:hypothetical protein
MWPASRPSLIERIQADPAYRNLRTVDIRAAIDDLERNGVIRVRRTQDGAPIDAELVHDSAELTITHQVGGTLP